MKVIGVTGGIGSGKTTVCQLLSKRLNCPFFSADVAVHNIIKQKEIIGKIKNYFGTCDFSKISKIIYNSSEKKKFLESLLHPKVKKELLKLIKQSNDKQYIVTEIPLLFEVKWEELFDIIITVVSAESKRFKRIVKLNKCFNKELFNKIVANQLSDDEKIKKANIVIENNSNIKKLTTIVNKIEL